MAKMIYNFFDEEDAFEQTQLAERFDSVEAGIDALDVETACAKGCLNDSHLPSFLSFSATKEVVAANKSDPYHIQNPGYVMTTTGPTGTYTGDSCYYNLNNTVSATLPIPPGSYPFVQICEQKAPPEDGDWEIIENAIGFNASLEIAIPETDLTDFENPALIVMMNVSLERMAFDYLVEDPANPGQFIPGWPGGVTGDNIDWAWAMGQCVAFAIQVQDADFDTWHHIYDPIGTADTTATANPFRRTERRAGWQTHNKVSLPDGEDATSVTPQYRDISIRCAISNDDLKHAYSFGAPNPVPLGDLYTISKIKAVRGVLSLVGCRAWDADAPNAPDNDRVDVSVYCAIGNANLTVLMPRVSRRTT
tara:strand:+ start:1502 stop:2590 length:1089 start_codon:yes stop_codon:yes gene_type:complete